MNTAFFVVSLIIDIAIGIGVLLPLQVSFAAPTDGFVQQNFTFDIQRPYNVSLNERYTFAHGVHTMWVFDDDKSWWTGSPTKSRTEMLFKVQGHGYKSGVWQFEGDLYMPKGTTGVAVMQIMGGKNGTSNTMQIRVYDGKLWQHDGTREHGDSQFEPYDVYERWIHVNVVHDADKKHVQIYLDRKLSFNASNSGKGEHYFKCGVYTQRNSSLRMESRWKNIKIWKRLTSGSVRSGHGDRVVPNILLLNIVGFGLGFL